MASTRAHLTISGHVQGVFFRASAQEEGERMGLNGWVRNVPTGEVEAEVEGPEADVDRFIDWCRHGPAYARVDHLQVTRLPATGADHGFVIRR